MTAPVRPSDLAEVLELAAVVHGEDVPAEAAGAWCALIVADHALAERTLSHLGAETAREIQQAVDAELARARPRGAS